MPAPEAGLAAYPHLFEPITVGTMRLRNRVMLPPRRLVFATKQAYALAELLVRS